MFKVEEYIRFMRENANMPHKSKYHTESYIDHVYGVIMGAMDTNLSYDNRLLVLSAALHDIGKPRTVKVVNGNARFYGHENVSDIDLEKFLDKSDKDFNSVMTLIQNHMLPYAMKGPEPWASEACHTMYGFIINNGSWMGSLLLMLNEFDQTAKHDLDEKQRRRVEAYLMLNMK